MKTVHKQISSCSSRNGTWDIRRCSLLYHYHSTNMRSVVLFISGISVGYVVILYSTQTHNHLQLWGVERAQVSLSDRWLLKRGQIGWNRYSTVCMFSVDLDQTLNTSLLHWVVSLFIKGLMHAYCTHYQTKEHFYLSPTVQML